MLKNSENNGMEKIDLVTPSPGQGVWFQHGQSEDKLITMATQWSATMTKTHKKLIYGE